MSIELKIKFKSLAEEAKIIKKEEQKQKKIFRKIGPAYEFYDKHMKTYNSLRDHRIDVVRLHARATHLARGYIKGMPYKRIENKTHYYDYRLDKMIVEMVKKYGGSEHDNVSIEAIKEWRSQETAS